MATEAHKRAVNKYNAIAYEQLNTRVYKGQKAQITAHAQSKGLSLNAYVMGLISADMGDKLTKPGKEQGE